MSSDLWKENVDENTSDAKLHQIIQAAARTSDVNFVKASGNAKAELARREHRKRMDELLMQINAQKEIVEAQIQATRALSEQQAKDAREQTARQMRISRSSAIAAWGAAVAAFLTLLFNILFELGVW
ncbi:MAG: hypothetical protein ACREGK_00820 [Geminicoccales bacterium]